MGLVQLFTNSTCPDVLARHLYDEALKDFRECALHYRIYLFMNFFDALGRKDPDEAIALRRALREHEIHERFPKRWKLADLFSAEAYAAEGESLFPKWAAALVQLTILDDAWEDALLGVKNPRRPELVPCFQAEPKADWSHEPEYSALECPTLQGSNPKPARDKDESMKEAQTI